MFVTLVIFVIWLGFFVFFYDLAWIRVTLVIWTEFGDSDDLG